MAKDTPSQFRNLVLYELFVRNHGPEGSFKNVEADLPRLKDMGIDVVWLMPIHPIGLVNRMGKWGSPFAITDYFAVNPEFGNKEDLYSLIRRAHGLGLKVMMDIVFNHIAKDSPLVHDHPEWFYHNETGEILSRVPEWPEVYDLKFPNRSLESYLIEALQGWAAFGFDGFRCDVASFMSQEFWIKARREVAKVKPGILWLAETVHARNVERRRLAGLPAFSDCEVYQAFDMTYDNDVWSMWRAVLAGKVSVMRYLEMIRFQDCVYPANFVKMRCVENHDRPRAASLIRTRESLLAWTAFQAFNKGSFLVYAGQESMETHGHFDGDRLEWDDYPLQSFITNLCKMKKSPAMVEGSFILTAAEPVIQAAWHTSQDSLHGIFNVSGNEGECDICLPDGAYQDILSRDRLEISNGKVKCPASACIFHYNSQVSPLPFYSELLDFDAAEVLPA